MPTICHICKIVNVQISHNYFSIYTSYEFTAINNVTRSTGILTFHIIGICPWTNMLAILHIHVPLHHHSSLIIDQTVLYISVETIKCNFNLPYYWHVCASIKYAPQMSHMGHMPTLFECIYGGLCLYIYIYIYIYIYCIWSCSNQWCRQNFYTQMTIMMPMTQDNDNNDTAQLDILMLVISVKQSS